MASSNKDSRRQKRKHEVNRELSLYVKGIVDGMNKRLLIETFETFGTVENLDVVPSKMCAFVEFYTKEAWQRALTQKSIDISNLGTVTVEERKVKGKKHGEDLGTVIVKEVKEKEQKLGENLGTDMADERDQVNRELSLYIKGVVNGMNRHVLDKTFRTFGIVINLDVVPSKSCAFVEFATEEAYQKALTQKSIEIPNFGIVTVEQRKPRTQNQRNRYKTSNSL